MVVGVGSSLHVKAVAEPEGKAEPATTTEVALELLTLAHLLKLVHVH